MKYAWLLLLVGCSSSTTVVTPSGTDAGPTEDAGVVEPVADAGAETGVAACDTTCRKLAFTATFDGAAAAFDRAQFGIETGGTRRVEAYGGGDPACPSESSPTPDRTLIFVGIGGDAPKVSYFDFVGSGAPVVKATAVKVTNVVMLDDVVAFDVDATFPSGSAKGHIASSLCASLSD